MLRGRISAISAPEVGGGISTGGGAPGFGGGASSGASSSGPAVGGAAVRAVVLAAVHQPLAAVAALQGSKMFEPLNL